MAGGLSPQSHDHQVHLAVWMPCERAVQMLAELTGVQIGAATARRQTYRAREAVIAVQEAQACCPAPAVPASIREGKLVISPDRAMVSLLQGQWAEVKTVAVGRVEQGKPGEPVHSSQLSSFSRMLDASTFTEHATAELL